MIIVLYDMSQLELWGKYYFIGRLVIHLNDKLIFHLKDNKGSVILPFENIKWMVPTTKVGVKVENKKEDYSWED